MKTRQNDNETRAAEAFERQSAVFDQIYSADTIIQYKRTRVRAHLEPYLSPGCEVLELNAGTGEDAIYLAERGCRVHATDIARGMQDQLAAKISGKTFAGSITHELCSFTQLDRLTAKGPYDMVFSNFAGLNCTRDLDQVLYSLSPLVKPGGSITLVLLPGFCLWETLLLCKGQVKTAFRRLSGRRGSQARVEGLPFRCYYYNPSYIITHLKKDFVLEGLEGLCTMVPPSYIEGFAEKYPRLFRFLCRSENRLKRTWPWRLIGDYYIISLRKR